MASLQMDKVRAQFPALVQADTDSQPYIFAENAGGSQVLGSVADAISSYLLSSNVQMANYSLAQKAHERVSMGVSAAAVLLGAESTKDVLIGQSATQLTFSLSQMIERRVLSDRKSGKAGAWQEGDEIVVSDADHETNRGSWIKLGKRLGLVVKSWSVNSEHAAHDGNPYEQVLHPDTVERVLTPRTRLVAFTACSNLLGAFIDIAEVSRRIRSVAPRALICVDCVAFAPHRRMEPKKWDVDVAFFSLYKTFGAHVGAMYVHPNVRRDHLEPLNHFFLQGASESDPSPFGMYPYQSSSIQYELNYSITAVADYLVSLGSEQMGEKGPAVDWNHVMTGLASQTTGTELLKRSRSEVDEALDSAFHAIAQQEQAILDVFIPYLLSKHSAGLRILGLESASIELRAPTISFCMVDPQTGISLPGSSAKIHSMLVATQQVGAQQGHMYAHALIDYFNLDLADGVVRLSFVHYNTVEEVKRCTSLLDQVLSTFLAQ